MTKLLFLLTEGSAFTPALAMLVLAAAFTLLMFFVQSVACWFDQDS